MIFFFYFSLESTGASASPSASGNVANAASTGIYSEVKACPRCQVLAVKMHDGSCNHMTCAVCGVEFCWLCMKEISDLHYLSPSGIIIRAFYMCFQLIYLCRILLKSQFSPTWNYMTFLFNFRLYLLGQKTMVEKKEIIVATWNPCGCSGRNRVFGMYFGTSYAHWYSIMGWT